MWTTAPADPAAAPVLGNGVLTARTVVLAEAGRVRFLLGHGDAEWLELLLPGPATRVRLKLDLRNAELSGVLTTIRGVVSFEAYVPHQRDVLVVSTSGRRVRWHASGTILRPAPGRRMAAAPSDADEPRPGDASDSARHAHRVWWNTYYEACVIRIPDRTLQRFVWTQRYLAAAVPATVASSGLLNTTNHTELDPFADAARVTTPDNHDHVRYGIPGLGARLGGSANPIESWALPARWTAYRFSGDHDLLRESVHPLLGRAVDFYGHFLTEGADGRLHLPVTHSPGFANVADSTYDLALLRWAARTALTSATLAGRREASVVRWRNITDRLTPYHKDATGVMVGAGVRLSRSHPVAAHLAWMYPLRQSRWSEPTARADMLTGYQHWAGMRSAWDPSSYATAGALAAAVRRPAEAVAHLTRFVEGGTLAGCELQLNGLYRRGSTSDPQVGFAAAQTVLGLLAEDGPKGIDLFHGVPAQWADVSVSGIQLPGRLLLDGVRRDGRTSWVRVRGGDGRLVTLHHGIEGKVVVGGDAGLVTNRGPGFLTVRSMSDGEVELSAV